MARGRTRGLVRVAVYYIVLSAVLYFAVQSVPFVRDIVSGARLGELESGLAGAFGLDPTAVTTNAPRGDGGTWDGALIAAFAMIGALVVMVPVTWVYMITHRRRGYDESVVHTLLILPVAVTGIVMVVQNSVALAFSLAGIVAAVRFRTTLDDTKDAVYVFLAIGVGLSAGVPALGIALSLSVVFNLVVLVLWWTQFGNIYADQNTRAGPLSVGDVLAGPRSAQSALRVGDPAVLEAATESDLAAIADRAVRIERHLSEERSKKKDRRANSLILLHAKEAGQAQAMAESVLEALSVRWKLAEISPGPSGSMLIYLALLDGDSTKGEVIDRMRASEEGLITAAELRSLKGLKPRA